jgi:hypothetical protein
LIWWSESVIDWMWSDSSDQVHGSNDTLIIYPYVFLDSLLWLINAVQIIKNTNIQRHYSSVCVCKVLLINLTELMISTKSEYDTLWCYQFQRNILWIQVTAVRWPANVDHTLITYHFIESRINVTKNFYVTFHTLYIIHFM